MKVIPYAQRLRALIDLVPDLSDRELDRLARVDEGLVVARRSQGHAGQILAGKKGAGAIIAAKHGRVLGSAPEWLLWGRGRAPGRAAVRRAVAVARETWATHLAADDAPRRGGRKASARAGA